jgi:hypothetical protein
MDKAGGYVLNVEARRRKSLLEAIHQEGRLAEAVPEFSHSRNAPLICFVGFEPGMVTHLASGRRGVRAGTGLRRLNLKGVIELPQPISHSEITDRMSARMSGLVSDRLARGGLLAPASFAALLEAVRELSPSSRPVLDRYSAERRRLIARFSAEVRGALAIQKETVATALTIAGLDRTELQAWEPTSDVPGSFLDGLSSARVREDAIVIGDLMHVPGFELVRRMPYGSAVFQREGVRLTVIVANHLPLEQQLGADLIYFNETYRSFIIVQYKVMERGRSDGVPFFRLPNEQLAKEIARMEATLDAIHGCPAADTRGGYRLLENPFFLKLCSRMIFEPDNVGLVSGMYFPLDLWRLIEADESLVGERGGRRVDFRNVGRYLDNSGFIALVSHAWIGTNVQQTELLEAAIRGVVQTGRTLTLAVKTDRKKWGNVEDSDVYDEESFEDEE